VTSRFRISRAVFLSTAAIVAFFISLIVATHGLVQIERDLDKGVGEDMAWTIMQAQLESIRFTEALTRFVNGYETTTSAHLELRHDILASRLALFNEGEPKRYLEQVGVLASLQDHLLAFDDVAREVAMITRGDRVREAGVLQKMQPLTTAVRETANRSMLAKRGLETELRAQHRWRVIEILIYMFGIMISGLILAILIIRSRQEIAAANETLRQERDLSRMYRTLVSIVSHQFRTPLAIIDSSAQRIRRRGTSMDAKEIGARTEYIRQAISSLSRLMDSTLDAARLDRGEINFKPRKIDLGRLIGSLRERYQGEETGRILTTDVSGLPATVTCDPTLIEQALSNILSNALKYSENSTPVHIRAWADRDQVLVAIDDSGIGIPPDEVDRVFEQFFRARTAEAIAGTGIGLSFAREIARLHGGDIGVTSEEGRGSTFTLRLPACGEIKR
jgi:signal transduction histidine kinase